MQLFYSPNSPYARKCRVVAIEKKLEKRVELINVNPLENPAELLAVNPLGTVPALVTDSGLHICESPAICEYLDSLSPENLLLPQTDRACVLAFAAMADGIMDAAVACVMEGRRPPEKQYKEWVNRKEKAIERAIAKFAGVKLENSPLSMGTINLAVALGYVSFRRPHIDWRAAHPALAAWYDGFATRPSMQATVPAL
jgi:glutathione S-transferase